MGLHMKIRRIARKGELKTKKRESETPKTDTLSSQTVKVELSEPLKTLGGVEIKTLILDFSRIKARDLAVIGRIEAKLKGVKDDFSMESLSKAASTEWRLAFAWIAACRGTKGLCYDDIDALSIPDVMELSTVALPFAVRT